MLAGLTAGAIAAIIAALVSLPLHSPVDSAFNSATVAVAALAVGLIAGLLWIWLSSRILWYGITLAVLFIVILAAALAGDSQLDRLASFSIPLAAIIVTVCAVLTPVLASFFLRPALGLLKWSPAIAVIAALAVGFGLVTQGDGESGELALPPPPPASPTATATPAPAATATATAAPAPAATAAPTAVPTAIAVPTTTAARPATARPVPATATPEPAPTAVPGEPSEAAQTFIIGEGSKITFTVEEELGRSPVRFDAVISSTGLTGAADLGGQPSVVALDLHSLSSDQSFRDRYIRERMFPDTPEAVFTVDRLPELPQSFHDGEETEGELSGSLKIGEAVTPLLFEVTARRDDGVINVLGRTTFTWEQLGLPKPSARSVVYLADEVRVQVLLVARSP